MKLVEACHGENIFFNPYTDRLLYWNMYREVSLSVVSSGSVRNYRQRGISFI